jgi:ATP-binding cassette, subfamily B, bacterial
MGPHAMLGSDPSQVAGATVGRDMVRRVYDFARPYRGMIAGFLGTIVATAVIELAPPLLFRAIIDDAIPDGDRGLLGILAGLAVLAAVVAALLALAERWWSSRIGEGVIFDLRVALFDHVQRMPIGFFTRTQTGALISRLNNDVIGAQRALTGTLGQVVSNVIVLVTTLVAMVLLQWQLTLLALALLPVFIIPAKRVGRRLQDMTRQQMDLNASMNTTMTERFGVSGALLVKLFGRHDDEVDEFSRRAGSVRDIGIRSAIYARTFFIALGLVGAVGVAAIYWVGGALVINGSMTLGTLVAMAFYVTRIYQPLTALTNARVDLLSTLVSFERVFEVLDAPNPLSDRPGAYELVQPRGRIEFDDVWFRYPGVEDVTVASLETAPTPGPHAGHGAHGGHPPATGGDRSAGAGPPGERGRPGEGDLPDAGGLPDDGTGDGTDEDRWVLSGIDVRIEPGRMVALVGPSGAGKTTVTALIPRLYDVTRGAIRIDGHDVRDLTQRSLRAAVGVVNQDPHLFHDSVADNLRYARPEATDDELEAACRAARIHDVIAALPQGYDTTVGERGYRLSGGEKQRLAIARMLLKDPAVVILDEATSHLDAENEAQVQAALATALVDRTSLVIAHRLSTVVAADVILVLDAGRVVQQGTHAELLATGGLYAELYRTLVREEVGTADVPDSVLGLDPSVTSAN